MSDHGDKPNEERRRLRKMNELLNQLPPEQRELLTQRISRSAPGLIRTKGEAHTAHGRSSQGVIDTPMRRAKSLARALLKRERETRLQKERWSPGDAQSDPLTETTSPHRDDLLWAHEGGDLSEEDLTLTRRDLPINALLSLDAECLLKAYLASDFEVWLKALKIADPEVKEHLLFTLPVRYASELEEGLRALGPMKLSEAQEAIRGVMAQVQRLDARGEVKLTIF